jgi:hypothetical protein
MPDRRKFLERITLGGALLAGRDLVAPLASGAIEDGVSGGQGRPWDLSWVDRITGKHRAVFDCTEIEDGAGFLRAMIWMAQYAETLGVSPAELTAVLVIRHNAIPLAMRQEFWDKYEIGKTKKVKDPFSEQPTTRNPMLLSAERQELPPPFAKFNLAGLLESKGIALACNLAFNECIRTVAKADGVDQAEARERALAMLLPGVTLQPSGVFAAIRAQEAGCTYLKAS